MRLKKICLVIVVSMFFAMGAYSGGIEEVSKDPRFAEAQGSYLKGVEFEERGDNEFRSRPGKAQRQYETAEDYYTIAIFKYKELGTEYGVDMSKDIDICEKRNRQLHVKTGKARRKANKVH